MKVVSQDNRFAIVFSGQHISLYSSVSNNGKYYFDTVQQVIGKEKFRRVRTNINIFFDEDIKKFKKLMKEETYSTVYNFVNQITYNFQNY